MYCWQFGWILVLLTALSADALARTESQSANLQFIEQIEPEYPISERKRSREGWVVLSYIVNSDGTVAAATIDDSSGSDAFEAAALAAVRNWRFETAEARKANAHFYFVYSQRRLRLSRKFFSRNAKIHALINDGKLDDAKVRIDEIRDNSALNAFELAYSFITEGRVASERGDQVEQLRCFRLAMLNQGRWLKREKYLKLLYIAVVLELQQQDYASALHHYALLTESSVGAIIAADIEAAIQAVELQFEGGPESAPPYMAANIEMLIKHEVRSRPGLDDLREGYPGGSIDESEPQEQPAQ